MHKCHQRHEATPISIFSLKPAKTIIQSAKYGLPEIFCFEATLCRVMILQVLPQYIGRGKLCRLIVTSSKDVLEGNEEYVNELNLKMLTKSKGNVKWFLR